MAEVTREQVLDVLARLPAGPGGVAPGERVSGLVLKSGNVGFALEVDAGAAEAWEPHRKAAEDAVRALPGVLSVTAVLTAHRSGGAKSAPPRQPAEPQGAPGIPGVGAVIAVASGKGGVGKSTLAVNLALGLQQLGLKTGLLDADIYGPSIPMMLGLKEKPAPTADKKLDPLRAYGLKTMSIGLLVDPDQPMIWRGPMVVSALSQLLSDVAWAPLDVLVIDMPPGTGDAQLTLTQRVPLAGAVIVSTPQEVALIDTRKGAAMFEKTHVPLLGVVENMAWFEGPDGTRTFLFGEGGARRTAEALGVPFLGEVPIYPEIGTGSDAGEPVVAADPDGKPARAFLEIAAKVAGALRAGATQKPPPRIVVMD